MSIVEYYIYGNEFRSRNFWELYFEYNQNAKFNYWYTTDYRVIEQQIIPISMNLKIKFFTRLKNRPFFSGLEWSLGFR